MPISRTTNTSRPVKRNLESATAARNASAIEIATVTPTITIELTTELQKYGRSIASRKCWSVGWSGIQVGVSLSMSSVGLNAVETIQKTGKIITTKTVRPSRFQPSFAPLTRASPTSASAGRTGR